jgi:hypothetical protein
MLSSTSLLFVLAAAGVQWGWEPSAGGGNTYIVQVEPELIDTFREQGFSSDVPPDLRDIRRIEIRVGSGALPHQGETVLKVPDKSDNDATKPPRLDAAEADAAAKRVPPQEPHLADDIAPPTTPTKRAPPQEPHLADAVVPAAKLSNAADAVSRPNLVQKPAESATSKKQEPTSTDGGSTNSANSAVADKNKSSTDGAHVARSERSPSEADAAPSHEPADTPSIPLLSAMGALILSAAGNVYLGWAQLGTRRRYREVVGQLRETDLPIAIEPHEEP